MMKVAYGINISEIQIHPSRTTPIHKIVPSLHWFLPEELCEGSPGV